MKNSLVALGAAGILAGGVSAQAPGPTLQSGPDAEVTVDGLYRVDNSRLQIAYMKPDIDLDRYTAFMLDPVAVAYQRDPGGRTGAGAPAGVDANFALTAAEMDELTGYFREAVVEALGRDGAYRIVETPGPDVLRITAQLIDLIVRLPRPTGAAQGVTRSYGEVTLVLEVRDSQSGEILAMAADRQDPTRNSGGQDLVSVAPSRIRTDTANLFEYWAGILRESLDGLREVEIEPAR
jgi:hypothetical protein